MGGAERGANLPARADARHARAWLGRARIKQRAWDLRRVALSFAAAHASAWRSPAFCADAKTSACWRRRIPYVNNAARLHGGRANCVALARSYAHSKQAGDLTQRAEPLLLHAARASITCPLRSMSPPLPAKETGFEANRLPLCALSLALGCATKRLPWRQCPFEGDAFSTCIAALPGSA